MTTPITPHGSSNYQSAQSLAANRKTKREGNTMDAEIIYRNFCESDGSGTFQDAWVEYENLHGHIEVGSLVEDLIIAAMQYALDHQEDAGQ